MVFQNGMEKACTYQKFGMGVTPMRVDCGVIEWVKHGSLRWSGHVMSEERIFEEGQTEGGDRNQSTG